MVVSLGFHHRKRRALDRVGYFSTIVSADANISGKLTGNNNILVFGNVEGDCDIGGTLILTRSGRWNGNILAANVVIAGEANGGVAALEKLELAPTAVINGMITSPDIAIAVGARHNGGISGPDGKRPSIFRNRRKGT